MRSWLLPERRRGVPRARIVDEGGAALALLGVVALLGAVGLIGAAVGAVLDASCLLAPHPLSCLR